ncbi:MAG: TetR/AcrR family transcriptional regulator [Planctomycetia bacterium]|nr:TetR/AcrR family transcriptional regulator [Planctomycetia bacterium]
MPRNSKGPTLKPGERRRQAILDAAYSLFVTKGYAAVSLDDILAISGGSKASIYKFFGNKRGVLEAVTESLARRMIDEMTPLPEGGGAVRESLVRMGVALGKLILGEKAIMQQRLAVTNLSVDPELSRGWYERGPKTTYDGFTEFLKEEERAGRLRMKDPARAAQFFLGMILGKDNLRMLAGGEAPPESELKDLVEQAVDVFLAAYGVPS